MSVTGKKILGGKVQYRRREESESAVAGAGCWNGGNSISSCDRWLAKNPWTGETAAGRVAHGL
ncbi:MAG TPA: hypothetical protein DEB70_06710 [Planctomycetaceae bacterium]|nr:hypothetical protein [Planctomycetaceae bacterium]